MPRVLTQQKSGAQVARELGIPRKPCMAGLPPTKPTRWNPLWAADV
ncbi:hypothetical protein [Sulfobacillus thermosulfidooxidans]|nr:hypothetical protein [Sulfobacillus thermosulfidooxidans]